MKRIIGILCGLFFFLFSFAQETFQKETYISSRGDTLLYRLLRPEVMKPDEKYPLVLFLHGAGERGNDNEKQLVHGGQMWLNPVNREKYPAFILAPQCPETGYWAYTERPSSFAPADMPLEVPVSPQNSKDKKDSKYDKSRKIKVLRGFLFLFSDIYQ